MGLFVFMWRTMTYVTSHHGTSTHTTHIMSYARGRVGQWGCVRYIYIHIYTDQENRLLTTKATVNMYIASVHISIITQTFLK